MPILDAKCYVCRRRPPALRKRPGLTGWCSYCRNQWATATKRTGMTPDEWWTHRTEPCSRCENAPRGEIHPRTPPTHWSLCRACRNPAVQKRHYRKHRAKILAHHREVRARKKAAVIPSAA